MRKRCVNCGGSGIDPQTDEICKWCKGTGWDEPLYDVRFNHVSIKLGLCESYLRDLEAWRGGDVDRFSRMTSGKGHDFAKNPHDGEVQLGDSDTWLSYARGILDRDEVMEHWPGKATLLKRRLERASDEGQSRSGVST